MSNAAPKHFSNLSLTDFATLNLRSQATVVKRMEPSHRRLLAEEALDLVNFYATSLLKPGASIIDTVGYSASPNSYTLWKKYLAIYTLLAGWFLEDELREKEIAAGIRKEDEDEA